MMIQEGKVKEIIKLTGREIEEAINVGLLPENEIKKAKELAKERWTEESKKGRKK